MANKLSIIGKKDADRLLGNMIAGIDGIPQQKKGSWIAYHEGPTWSLPSRIGKVARDLEQQRRAILVQKKVRDDWFVWYAVVR